MLHRNWGHIVPPDPGSTGHHKVTGYFRHNWSLLLVDLSVDADIEAGFPSRRAAQISIETTQGETLEHYAPTRKGDPDNPLTDDELTDKFLEITNPVLGEDGAAAYLDQLWRLDETDDLCALPLTPTKANAAQ